MPKTKEYLVATLLQRLGALAFRHPATGLRPGLEQIRPGFNGPLTLLVQAHPGTDPKTAAAVAATVKTLPDVLTGTPAQLGTDGHTAVVGVIPGSGPHNSATTHLVDTIRAQAPVTARADAADVAVEDTAAS